MPTGATGQVPKPGPAWPAHAGPAPAAPEERADPVWQRRAAVAVLTVSVLWLGALGLLGTWLARWLFGSG